MASLGSLAALGASESLAALVPGVAAGAVQLGAGLAGDYVYRKARDYWKSHPRDSRKYEKSYLRSKVGKIHSGYRPKAAKTSSTSADAEEMSWAGYKRPRQEQAQRIIVTRDQRMPLYPLVGFETKYFDCGFAKTVTAAGTTWADTEVTCDNYVASSGATAAYTDCCLIPTAQGTGYGQVSGQRYELLKLRVRGSVQVQFDGDLTDPTGPRTVRILMVMDTQPNGAQAQGEDVIQDFGAAPENVFAFQRMATQTGRFKILKDKLIMLQPAVAGTDGANTISENWEGRNFKMTYKPRGLKVEIANGNATPTVGGCISHNIFLLMYGAYSSATGVITYGCSRAYYKG